MKGIVTVCEFIRIAVPIILTAIGGYAGLEFGAVGLVIGLAVGLSSGIYAGRYLADYSPLRGPVQRVSSASTAELRAHLHAPEIDYAFPPNFILLELNRRGEVTRSDLQVVFDMLESDDVARRRCGVAAITSAFPEIAQKAPDYSIKDSRGACRRKVRELRDFAEQSVPR